jgi:hypothetical protein
MPLNWESVNRFQLLVGAPEYLQHPWTQWSGHLWHLERYKTQLQPSLRLLRVSKQIHAKAAAVYYGQEFRFSNCQGWYLLHVWREELAWKTSIYFAISQSAIQVLPLPLMSRSSLHSITQVHVHLLEPRPIRSISLPYPYRECCRGCRVTGTIPMAGCVTP